jgi:hypothetical protein
MFNYDFIIVFPSELRYDSEGAEAKSSNLNTKYLETKPEEEARRGIKFLRTFSSSFFQSEAKAFFAPREPENEAKRLVIELKTFCAPFV